MNQRKTAAGAKWAMLRKCYGLAVSRGRKQAPPFGKRFIVFSLANILNMRTVDRVASRPRYGGWDKAVQRHAFAWNASRSDRC